MRRTAREEEGGEASFATDAGYQAASEDCPKRRTRTATGPSGASELEAAAGRGASSAEWG